MDHISDGILGIQGIQGIRLQRIQKIWEIEGIVNKNIYFNVNSKQWTVNFNQPMVNNKELKSISEQ